MSTVDAKTPGISGPGHIGWHLQDEADMSVRDPREPAAAEGPGTRHVPDGDRPLLDARRPARRADERSTRSSSTRADVVGFDTYPVEGRCSLAQIDNVYWMQREIVSLTRRQADLPVDRGRPDGALPRERQDPTPAVVRAETWLAIAGGARGIGYFPDWWEETIRSEVRLTNREILALAPALLSPVAKANWSTESPVRIGARRYNGATYVIAVEHVDLGGDRGLLGARTRRSRAARLPRRPNRQAARRPRDGQAPRPRRRDVRRPAAAAGRQLPRATVGAMRSALALVAVLLGVVVLSSSAIGAESAPAARPARHDVRRLDRRLAQRTSPTRGSSSARALDLRLELAPCRKLVPVGCAYQGCSPAVGARHREVVVARRSSATSSSSPSATTTRRTTTRRTWRRWPTRSSIAGSRT